MHIYIHSFHCIGLHYADEIHFMYKKIICTCEYSSGRLTWLSFMTDPNQLLLRCRTLWKTHQLIRTYYVHKNPYIHIKVHTHICISRIISLHSHTLTCRTQSCTCCSSCSILVLVTPSLQRINDPQTKTLFNGNSIHRVWPSLSIIDHEFINHQFSTNEPLMNHQWTINSPPINH